MAYQDRSELCLQLMQCLGRVVVRMDQHAVCVIRGFMQHSVERLRCGEGFTEWTGGVSTAREIVHIMHHAHDGPTHLPSLRLRCLVIYLHGQVFTHLQTEL